MKFWNYLKLTILLLVLILSFIFPFKIILTGMGYKININLLLFTLALIVTHYSLYYANVIPVLWKQHKTKKANKDAYDNLEKILAQVVQGNIPSNYELEGNTTVSANIIRAKNFEEFGDLHRAWGLYEDLKKTKFRSMALVRLIKISLSELKIKTANKLVDEWLELGNTKDNLGRKLSRYARIMRNKITIDPAISFEKGSSAENELIENLKKSAKINLIKNSENSKKLTFLNKNDIERQNALEIFTRIIETNIFDANIPETDVFESKNEASLEKSLKEKLTKKEEVLNKIDAEDLSNRMLINKELNKFGSSEIELVDKKQNWLEKYFEKFEKYSCKDLEKDLKNSFNHLPDLPYVGLCLAEFYLKNNSQRKALSILEDTILRAPHRDNIRCYIKIKKSIGKINTKMNEYCILEQLLTKSNYESLYYLLNCSVKNHLLNKTMELSEKFLKNNNNTYTVEILNLLKSIPNFRKPEYVMNNPSWRCICCNKKYKEYQTYCNNCLGVDIINWILPKEKVAYTC